MARVASGACLTCHKYNSGKSDKIGHRQHPKLQDPWSSPNILILYSLSLMDSAYELLNTYSQNGLKICLGGEL